MFDQIYNYVVSQMQTNQFFSGAALSAVLLSGFYSLKSIPMYLWGRLKRLLEFHATIEQKENLFNYIDEWIEANHNQDLRRVEIIGRYGTDELAKSNENDFIFVWKNWRRIRISKSKSAIDAPGERSDLFRRTYNISGILAKSAIINLLQQINDRGIAERKLREETKKEIKIFISSNQSYENWKTLRGKSTNKPFSDVYISNRQEIIDDIQKFADSANLYEDLKVAHKRGYLFYGPPGTGKTTLSWAIADKLKYDLYILDLAAFSNVSDFKRAIGMVPNKSVVVIEDIDSFYDGRECVKENKIPFSSFINCLSGLNQVSDSITIITTNHVDKIDPALLRSGRCDVKLEIKPITIVEAQTFLQEKVDPNIVLTSFRNMPFVELQEIALKYHDTPDEIIRIIDNDGEQVQEQTNGDIQI